MMANGGKKWGFLDGILTVELSSGMAKKNCQSPEKAFFSFRSFFGTLKVPERLRSSGEESVAGIVDIMRICCNTTNYSFRLSVGPGFAGFQRIGKSHFP